MKTEEEIIKALKICSTINLCNNDCPYYGMHYGIRNSSNCRVTRMNDTLNLIREKNAEIERLNAENMLTISERNAFRTSFYEVSRQLKHAKSEAVKEFAKRLKKDACYFGRAVAVEDIDNIAEEMVGEE